ncbi:CYTH and CHAD domain-containing protein [Streptomyces sp. JJ36]|uniref:CYTH and CHAD domain-containing protein n=1 Tax=Streptomyces sp. JJ36 TaxID=2736645 RepID=UPI001F342E23|nr:CYTH and CHAD domain-containing protein [Streptomyces sp. JJ36]MCF6525338.1 CYTH and CHAD domain-containing protein [Streptomyces sp. JJ36]
MADVVREVERKYEVADGDDPAALLPALDVKGVRSVVDRGTVRLDATYYDTADGRLAADGLTLRRRTGGPDEGWHLKLPVEPGVREEIRAPLSNAPPRALTSLVRSRTRGVPLAPVIRLRSDRHVWRLEEDSGALLAEVAVDAVHAERTAGGDGPGGRGDDDGAPDGVSGPGRTTAWTEIEVELGDAGGAKLLDRVEKRLRGAGLRRSSSASKLERALARTAPAGTRPPGVPTARTPRTETVPAGGSAGDTVLRYVREQVTALVELDPAVRRDLPDAVHRMRVATRRLRSCFRSYGTVLDRRVTDPLGEELRWLAGELGYDRDREVLTARLADAVAELPRPLLHGPVRGRLRTFAHARRSGSRRRLLGVLDGKRYLALLDRLDALLADPPLRRAAAGPAREALAATVHRDTGRLASRLGRALDLPPGPDRDLALHDARKAAKRARYAAEAARPALGKPAKEYRRRLTTVQEHLGDHQDSVVAREALREIARQAHDAGEHSFTYGVLYQRESDRAAARERELPGLWRETAAALRDAGLPGPAAARTGDGRRAR